jgi:hypothetical protein
MSEEAKPRMKPVIILPKGEMSPEDIAILRDNLFCVVEAEHPGDVRFMEPPPSSDYSNAERAAINLCRYLLNNPPSNGYRDQSFIVAKFMYYVIEGTPLAANAPPPVAPVIQNKQRRAKSQ